MSFLKQIIDESKSPQNKTSVFIKNYGYNKAIRAITESCKQGKVSKKQAKHLIETVLKTKKQNLLEDMNYDMDQYGNDKQIDFSKYDSNPEQDDLDIDLDDDDDCDTVDVDSLSPAELAQEIEDLKHDLEQASERGEDQQIIDQIIDNLKCIKSAIEDKLENGDSQDDSLDQDDFESGDFEGDDFDEFKDFDDSEFDDLDLDNFDDTQFNDDDFEDDFGDDYDQDFEGDDFSELNDDSQQVREPSIQNRQQKQSLRDRELRRPSREMGEENEEQSMPDWMRKAVAGLQTRSEENEEFSGRQRPNQTKDYNQGVQRLVSAAKEKNFTDQHQVLNFIKRVIQNQPTAFEGVSPEYVLKAYNQSSNEENEEQTMPDWMRKALGEAVSTDIDKAKSHRARVDGILRAKGSAAHKSPKDYDRKKDKLEVKKELDK